MNICMTLLKSQQTVRIVEFAQWIGLILLIGFVYRHFGPEARQPITPSVIAIFAASVYLLLGPMPLKAKE